jgi:hypothetical protein
VVPLSEEPNPWCNLHPDTGSETVGKLKEEHDPDGGEGDRIKGCLNYARRSTTTTTLLASNSLKSVGSLQIRVEFEFCPILPYPDRTLPSPSFFGHLTGSCGKRDPAGRWQLA